jgi:hypothetical protein
MKPLLMDMISCIINPFVFMLEAARRIRSGNGVASLK